MIEMWPFEKPKPDIRPLVEFIVKSVGDNGIWQIEDKNICVRYNRYCGFLILTHHKSKLRITYSHWADSARYEPPKSERTLGFQEGFNFALTYDENIALTKAFDNLLEQIYKKKEDAKYNKCYEAVLDI